jgi:CRISPR/Cas system type I-B associated protein Csh2 (Cas7 group RAMP superfamily)
VKFTTAKSSYEVVLNAKGLELGQTMDGKKVEVTGIIQHKETQKWIDVKNFKQVAETPKAK